MPLSGNFSLRNLQSEFGNNSTPPSTLRTAATRIFGAGNENGKSLRSFNGYGQPVITNFVAATGVQDAQGGLIDIDFDLDIGGMDTYVQVQWRENGDVTWIDHTTAFNTFNANGSFGFGFRMSDVNKYYNFRLKHYNEFNNNSLDYKYTAVDSAFSALPNTWDAPNAIFITDNGTTVTIEFAYGADPSTFEMQWSNTGGSTWTNATYQSNTNWGTWTNNKTGTWLWSGDRVRFRAAAELGVAASPWSSEYVQGIPIFPS